MPAKQRRYSNRRVPCWLLSALLALLSLPGFAGHDQPQEDLVYFLPIAAERVKRLLDSGEKLLLVDLRSRQEFERQHLPGARSIPRTELDKRFHEIPRTGRVVLYCACAPDKIEESYAYQFLRGLSYRNVSVLEGGFNEWRKRGYPIEGATP